MFIKHNRFFIAIILLIVIILTACQPQATPQPTPALSLTATLKEVTGTVTIKQPGASAFSPASIGTELQLNGSVQTGDDGRARLDLSTGTIIRVAPTSLFTLTSNQPSNGSLATQLNLNAGTVFIILNGGTASVNTPSGVASVKGSYLSVYVDPATQTVVVTCLEGHCGASNSAGSVDFGTGEEVTLFSCTAGQCTVPSIGPMTPQEFQDWLDNNPDLQQIPGLFATMTALVATQPSATETPIAPTTVPTFTPAPVSCLNHLVGPSAGSHLDATGTVKFSWDARDGASQYELTIHFPDGSTASSYTNNTSITRYLESMPTGGTYTWDLTVYDNSGNQICQTGEGTFSKQNFETPVPTAQHQHLDCSKHPNQWFDEESNPLPPCSCYRPKNSNATWCLNE
ncbi:MAG: FecR family protein [Anaerolineales bacterium]